MEIKVNSEVRVKIKGENGYTSQCFGTVIELNNNEAKVAGILPNGEPFLKLFSLDSIEFLSESAIFLRNT